MQSACWKTGADKYEKRRNKMKLYNTLTKKKEEFVPLTEGQVKM